MIVFQSRILGEVVGNSLQRNRFGRSRFSFVVFDRFGFCVAFEKIVVVVRILQFENIDRIRFCVSAKLNRRNIVFNSMFSMIRL